MDVTVMSATCHRAGRVFAHNMSGQAEQRLASPSPRNPWILVQGSAWVFPSTGTAGRTQQRLLRVFRHVLDMAGLGGHLISTQDIMGARGDDNEEEGHQVDWTGDVHVAGFEVDWRHIVAFLAVVPPSSQAMMTKLPTPPSPSRPSPVLPRPRHNDVAPATTSTTSRHTWRPSVQGWTCKLNVRCDGSTWKLTRYVSLTTPQVTLNTVNSSSSPSPRRNQAGVVVGSWSVAMAVSEWGVQCQDRRVLWSDGIAATLDLEHTKHPPVLCLHQDESSEFDSIDVDVAIALDTVACFMSPLDVVLLASTPVPLSSRARVDSSHPPTASESVGSPSSSSTVAWCIKAGVQVQHVDVQLLCPSNRIHFIARNLSTALRTGNYPPLHPVAPSHTTFVDSQLLLLDMSMLEDRTLSHTCWLLHAMPSSSLLGVLLCLEPRDIHSFAVAAGVTDIQAPEMIDTDAVLRWQYATHLARQCITAPATMPRPRRRATQPLLCTAHSFAMPSDDEGDSVFLALFVRNSYTGIESSSSPRAAATTLHVTGHMEAMDIVVTLPSVQSIVDVADTISRQCSFRSSPQTATTPSKYQGVPDITFQVETLRVFLPTHTMLCIDHIHVDSGLPPLSMEGLSSPPFTPWTQKRRRPTIAPQPTADLTPHKLHTRLTNVYVATVQCRPDDQGTGPFEVCMARVGRRQALRIASVTYLVHPIFVSVEVAASSPHVSLHVTKVVVDLPRYAQSMALAGLAGAYVAAVRQSSIVRRQNRTRGPRASQYQQIVRPEEEHEEAEDILDSLCLFGWRVAVDGLELHVGTPPDTCQGTLRSSIVHVRVGCMSAVHSATSRQGSVSVKNVVVGFQSGDANEALIFGPFADPSEWQVAVERYPDTVLAASWSFESTHGWLWTGLVELQGVQCHVSVPFLHAIRPFTVGTTPAPQTNSIQTSSAADGVREPLHTTVSVAGVRPIRQCKLKLLWAPSVVTMSSSHENDDKASIMVTCGPTFASLHVGYNPTQVEQLVTCQQPRSSLHQYMPLDVVETMGTIQGIRVAVLHTVRFPTTTKPFGSPTPSSSSWTVFEAQIQSPDPASVLLQDVQVRMSASVKQVVESTQALERRNSRRLYCGGYYMTDVQLETTPMDAAICFQTWMRLHALVSELVSSSLSDEMDETNPCTPYARPDPMHRLHLESLPTLDDFAELVHTSTDSSRVHPLPGELLVCRPTPSPPNQFDTTTIMRLLNPQNQVSSVDDLFKHMNAPWTHDTMNAVDLHSNRLVGSLQWTYHLPRRVTRVVAMPLPLKSKQIVNTLEWPRLDLSDHVTRLCDVWCDLRWWSMADNAFVSVGTFYVPWEPQQHKASADDYDDEDGDGYPSSFASALLSWVEPSTPTDEDIALERCLQSTVTPREYIPHRVESAQRWQLLWRLPSSSPSTSSSAGVDLVSSQRSTPYEQLSRTIGQSLMASLRISSVSGPQDWTGLSLSCVIPHVQMTLRRGQGELHDVARVKVADVVLHMQCASSSSSSSSFRGTGTVSGDLQNMVTLSSVPVLPPVQVAIGGSSSYRPAASPEDKRRHLLCPLGSTDRNLPQILFLTRLNVRASPVHLQLTPYAVKCLLEWPTLLGHTPKQDLTDMRIVLANGTGNVVYFRQLLTTEYRQVSAHTSVVYSWQSISAPLQLQFALSQPPHTWSTGCALNQPGVLYRECPSHGSFWVDIVADGIQTKVTLRGSIVLHNYTAQSLRCRWSVSSNSVANTIVNAAMPCTACSRNDVCSCTAVSVMAQSNAMLSLGLELPSCASSHEDESSGGGWSTPVNLEPSVERLESATTTSQSNSTATFISIHTLKSQWHAWVVVTRAVSPVVRT
ncbi:hypothetical protein AaE_012536 [Aphanomyces astaci]|uniref:Uncharacterized protein n=1 Tax=Aphanomyces astaci TaxID=112090 RepID=A0A6A4ZFS1_APHAT|nr:hypothetical protein AaE_012536 [Aphanomyces astaci]